MNEQNPPPESVIVYGRDFYNRVSAELTDYVKYLESKVESQDKALDELTRTIGDKHEEIRKLLDDINRYRANGNVSASLMLEYHSRLGATKKWLRELRENESRGEYISGPKNSFINGVIETIERLEIQNENFEDNNIVEDIERIHKDIKEMIGTYNTDPNPMLSNYITIRKYLGVIGKTLDILITSMFHDSSIMRKVHQVRLRDAAMNMKLLNGGPVNEDSWVY